MNEISSAYSSEPWWYDVRGFFILTFAYNSTLPRQLRFFAGNFGPRHLELACGTGTLLEMVLKWRRWKRLPATHITGVDYAERMLGGAKVRFRGQPDMEFLQADAAALPFEANRFDTANIANAVHCLPEVDRSLRELSRVLKPGGTVAVNVLLYPRGPWPLGPIAERINRWGIRKGILVTPYEASDIRARFVAAGFEVVSETISGNCLELVARKPASLPSPVA